MIFFCIIAVYAFVQIEPKRDNLDLNSPVMNVVQNLGTMDSLMNKVPRTLMVNYFVDNEGYLFLSNQKVGKLLGAENNPKVRKDLFFLSFEKNEIDSFFRLMHFLRKNDIEGCRFDKSIGKFIYSYKNAGIYSTPALRFVIHVASSIDTVNNSFRHQYKVLDKEGSIILVSPVTREEPE